MAASLAKGTKVLVRTTNGGELVGTLEWAYVPSYDVTLVAVEHYPSPGGVTRIPHHRVKEVLTWA